MGFCLFCRTDKARVAPLETGANVGICLPCARGATRRLEVGEAAAGKKYVDHRDRLIFVSKGIGSLFGTFRRKPGGSLKRVVSSKLPMVRTREEAQEALDAYANALGLTAVPEAGMALNGLSLVMEDAPPLEEIASWTDVERAQVVKWALAAHLRASDNPVRVPPLPDVIHAWKTRKEAC